MIESVRCPMAKSCKMLTKLPDLWYKCYLLDWDFSSQKSAPCQKKTFSPGMGVSQKGQLSLGIPFPSCIEDFGPKVCSWTHLFLHSSKKMAVWPEDNLLCILSSSEFLPWEPQKRLKHEKIPVCRAALRFNCTSRDPQIPPFSSHLKSSAYVKKISFCCLLRGGGEEKIIWVQTCYI